MLCCTAGADGTWREVDVLDGRFGAGEWGKANDFFAQEQRPATNSVSSPSSSPELR